MKMRQRELKFRFLATSFSQLALAAPQRLKPCGGAMSSQSSLNTKSRALVLFEQFRQCAPPEVKQKLPREWAELGAEELCDTAVWDGFAKYLSEIYVIERGGHREGQPLLLGSQYDYLGAVLNQTKARFGADGTDRSRIFFTCLDGNSKTDESKWMYKLKEKMLKIAFKFLRDSGATLDNSVMPVYGAQIAAINRAYAREGSSEARVARRELRTPSRPIVCASSNW